MGRQAHFDEISEEYASYYEDPSGILSREKTRRLESALTMANVAAGDRVLNVGVGAGELFRSVPTDVRTIGADFSKDMISTARDRAPADYVLGAIQSLPFRSETFDTVFCLGVVGYLDPGELEVAVRELSRVVAPGGDIVLSFANAVSPFRRFRQFYYYDLLEHGKRILNVGQPVNDPYAAYTPRRVLSSLEGERCSTVDRRYLTYSTGIFNTRLNHGIYRSLDRRFDSNDLLGYLAMTWIVRARKRK